MTKEKMEVIIKLETLLLNVDALMCAADQIGPDNDDPEMHEHFCALFYMAKDKFAELKNEFYRKENPQ